MKIYFHGLNVFYWQFVHAVRLSLRCQSQRVTITNNTTMSQYLEMTNTAWNKFASYSKFQCEFAIRDIHATLAVTPNGNDYRDSYTQKLWCELDAARDRIREIDLASGKGEA